MPTRAKPFVGIDLGGTNMQIGVVAPGNQITGRARKKTMAEKGQASVIARVVEGVHGACEQAGITVAQLGGVGIGAPGAIDPAAGVVLEAVNLRWNNVPLARILQARLKVPVLVDNDVNVAVYGEWKAGAAKGDRDVLGVWVGTGIGGGLVLGGRLHYGHFLTAGEIGHMHVLPTNPPGQRTLEHNCSRSAVVERIVRLVRSNRKSMVTELVQGDFDKIRSKTIAEAYAAGDSLVREVVDDSADLLGAHVGGIVTLLALPRVVLGGGLTEAVGSPYVARVRDAVRRVAFPDKCKAVDVVASELLDDAGIIGAALLAAEKIDGQAAAKRQSGRATV